MKKEKNMEKQTLNKELMKLYEGYEKIDNPQPKIVEGTDDVYLKNGYINTSLKI